MQSPAPSQDSPTKRIEPPDPARLAEQICIILTDETDPHRKLDLLLHQTVGLVNAAGAFFFGKHGDEVRSIGQLISKQALNWSDNLADECGEIASRAMEERKASLAPLRANNSVSVISCPVPGRSEGEYFCLSVLAILGDHAAEPYLIVLQLLAATLAQTNGEVGPSPLLELLAQPRHSSNLQSIGSGLRQWADCDIVAIGLSERQSAPRLSHVSDVASLDRKTHRSRLYQKVMGEVQRREVPLVWPQDPETEDESSLLLKELVQDTGMQQGCALSLTGPGSATVTLVMLWQKQDDRSSALAELQDHRSLLAPLLIQALRNERHAGARDGAAGFSTTRKAITAVVLAIFFGWFSFYPMAFNLHPEALVKPVQLRYVVAKFDGLIKEVYVEPGDKVELGGDLASLDGREIALELSSLEADSTKALKMRDNHHVKGDVAAAQIAQLEYQRLQERAALLTIRQSQLEIISPTGGIVLSGDIKRRTGGPVSRGQVLFEIAPLDPVLVQMGISDQDIGHVREGLEVTVRFDAFPGRAWSGSVEKVSPASQLIDSRNLFTATFELDNEDGALQPGMRGDGSIQVSQRSPAWIYFHKPIQSLMRLLRSLF